MPTSKTVLYPPPIRGTLVNPDGSLGLALQKWLFSVQNLEQLITVDTTAGADSQALPPAGDLSGVGQNNLNQEIVFKKISADANVFTITGAAEGPQTLTAQYSTIRFKSDGTNWWVVGVLTP